MSADEALAELAQTLQTDLDANLVLGSLEGDGSGPALVKLTLLQEPQEEFLINARSLVRRLGRARKLVPYEPGYKPEADEILYVDLDQELELKRIVTAVGRLQTISPLSEDPDSIADGGFSAQIFGSGSRRASFFAQFTPKNELAKRKGVSLILGHNGFDVIRRRVFLFDDQADCVAFRNYVFIWSLPAFERIFHYFERARARVDEVVASITKTIPIENLDAFKESCRSQPQMIAKTLSIGRKPYLDRITMARIKVVIDEFDLEIRTVMVNGVEKLLFENDAERRWLILKLLDDDYLYSEMTEVRYAANSKQSV